MSGLDSQSFKLYPSKIYYSFLNWHGLTSHDMLLPMLVSARVFLPGRTCFGCKLFPLLLKQHIREISESEKSKMLYFTKKNPLKVCDIILFQICLTIWKHFFFLVHLENSKFVTFSPIRGSSVLGKPMEYWNVIACSVRF